MVEDQACCQHPHSEQCFILDDRSTLTVMCEMAESTYWSLESLGIAAFALQLGSPCSTYKIPSSPGIRAEQSCFSLCYQLFSFISEKDPRTGTPKGLCPPTSQSPPLSPFEQLLQAVLFLPGNPGLPCTWRKPIPPAVCAPVCIQTSL